MTALKHVRTALRSWSKNNFGQVMVELEELRVKLEEGRADPLCRKAAVRQISDRMTNCCIEKK